MDTAFAALAFAMETSFGVLPGSPRWYYMRVLSEALDRRQTTQQSQELNPLMQGRKMFRTDLDVGGTVNAEMSYGSHDDFLKMMLRSAPTKTPEKVGTTEVTSITGANTININSGGAAFLAGMLVKTEYFPSAVNNGVKKVASNTGTTIVIAGGGLTNESSAARTSVKVCGFEGTADDITAVTVGGNSLVTTTLDFTTLGLQPGQWVSVGGGTTGTKFATATTNGMCRIDPTKAISANRLYFDIVPTSFTADAGAGKTIWVMWGDVMRNGINIYSGTIQEQILSTPEYKQISGLTLGSGQIQLAIGSAITLGLNFDVGKAIAHSGTDLTSGGTIAARDDDVMNVIDNFDSLYIDGVPSSYHITSLSIRAANNPRARKALGVLGPWGAGRGLFGGTLALEMYHEDSSMINRFHNFTRLGIAFRTRDLAGAGYMYTMPRAVVSTGSLNNPGTNQDFMDRIELGTEPDLSQAYHVQIDKLPQTYN